MDAIELEEFGGDYKPVADERPLMPEPPPVRLIAIDDVHLPVSSGQEREMDAFYIGRLRFVRKPDDEADGVLIYHAENQRLCFDILEPPIARDSVRPIGMEITWLNELEIQLIEDQIPHTRQVGLLPGEESLLLQDPAGNWLQIQQARPVH
ncbi:MAG: hypothetical protein JO353_02280 [Phycisphaerae bacterium]|nr:hypothetical protein [Phycisphaerae bacterium]